MTQRLICLFAMCVIASGCVGDPPVAASDDAGNLSTGDAGTGEGDFGPGLPTFESGVRSTAGLLAYYPVRDDPPGELVDYSGNQRNIRLSSNVVVSDGQISIPGNEAVNVPQAAAILEQMQDEFTFEIWVQSNGYAGQSLASIGVNELYSSEDTTEAHRPVCLVDCAADSGGVRSTHVIEEMQQFVVTGADGVVSIYVDGSLAGAWQASVADVIGDGDLSFGPNASGREQNVSLVAVYDRALSAGEVLSHFLVGPNPAPNDEVDAVGSNLLAVTAEAGLHGGFPVSVTIRDGSNSVPDRLSVSDTQHGLLILRSGQTATDAELVAARLNGVVDVNSRSETGRLSVFRMLAEWNTGADWGERLDGQPWSSPGGASPADRLQLGVVSIGPTRNPPRTFSVDALTAVAAWEAGEPNYGFMFACDAACAFELAAERDWTHGSGLRLLSLYSATPTALGPEAPTNFEAVPTGELVSLSWDSDHLVEVWFGGRLRLRTAASLVEILSPEATTIEIRSVDQWGRASSFVRAQ